MMDCSLDAVGSGTVDLPRRFGHDDCYNLLGITPAKISEVALDKVLGQAARVAVVGAQINSFQANGQSNIVADACADVRLTWDVSAGICRAIVNPPQPALGRVSVTLSAGAQALLADAPLKGELNVKERNTLTYTLSVKTFAGTTSCGVTTKTMIISRVNRIFLSAPDRVGPTRSFPNFGSGTDSNGNGFIFHLYPFVHVVPSGEVLVHWKRTTALYDPSADSWTRTGWPLFGGALGQTRYSFSRTGPGPGTSALLMLIPRRDPQTSNITYPAGGILILGGGGAEGEPDPPIPGEVYKDSNGVDLLNVQTLATDTAEILNLDDRAPQQWRWTGHDQAIPPSCSWSV